jgi:signal transduction histidine kinase
MRAMSGARWENNRDEVLRSFVHAIREPLNGARLHLVFLERELARLGASEQALDAAGVIADEIDRAAALVRELENAPLGDHGARTLVPLSALCAAAVDLVSREAGVQVGTELEDPDLMLEVRQEEMEQVLRRLLQRALGAALGGGGRVLLRARRDPESGHASIQIEHDGGESSALDPALGVDSSSSDFRIAISIVAEHGGTIEANSRPGQTSFHVKLPLSRGQATRQDAGTGSR